MKKALCLITCLLFIMTSSACAAQENIDSALEQAASMGSDLKESVVLIKDKTVNSVNTLGAELNLNGEYGTTTERFSAFANSFKTQVTNKLEQENYGVYLDALNKEVSFMQGFYSKVQSALVPTEFETTQSYAYFNSFDFNNYDMLYTIYKMSDNENAVNFTRNRTVKRDEMASLQAYNSVYQFNTGKQETFDLLGLTFFSCENNTWYDCNQLFKTKAELPETPEAFELTEKILSLYSKENFKSSTLNNLLASDGRIVELYSKDNISTAFVFQDSILKNIIYTVGEDVYICDIQAIKSGDEVSSELLTASLDYSKS